MFFYLLNYGYHSLLQVIELKMSISLISGRGWFSFKQQLYDELLRAHMALNQATQTASNALAADTNTAAAAKAAAIYDYSVVYYRFEAYLEIEPYEKEIAARYEKDRRLRCDRRFVRHELNIIKNFNKYKLVNRIDIAAKEYIKENPLQDNIHLTGTTFNNCTKNRFKSANHYDIKVAVKLSNLFLEAGVSQSNVIKAIHIMNKHFFKDKTKTIQYLRNLFMEGSMYQYNFITPYDIMHYKTDENTIQYFFPVILRNLNNWDSWDFELNCALDCTTYPNTYKFFEIDTFFKRKCSKLVTKEDIKEFKEFEDNKLIATFLLVNQRLVSTGKYVSISILDMLYLLKRYDNKLR